MGLFNRRKKKKSRGPDLLDADCCCVVGELFDGPCFVASAGHDAEVAEPVRVLRAYRDERLVHHRPGRLFARCYYRYGRYGAAFLRRFPVLKPVARAALMPIV